MLKFYSQTFVPLLVLLPIAAGISCFKTLRKPYIFLFFYLLLSGAADLIMIIMNRHHYITDNIAHFYTPLEFLLIAAFYRCSFLTNATIRKIILWLMIVFSAFCILDPIFLQDIYTFDSYTTSVESVILIAFSIALMNKNSYLTDTRWQEHPGNWFNTGILIYFSGAFFFFILVNYLTYIPKPITALAIALHATMLLALYILFTIGFIRYKHAR